MTVNFEHFTNYELVKFDGMVYNMLVRIPCQLDDTECKKQYCKVRGICDFCSSLQEEIQNEYERRKEAGNYGPNIH